MTEVRNEIHDEYVRDLLDNMILPFGSGNASVMEYHRIFVRRYANTLRELAHVPRTARVLELAANPYGMTAALAGDMFDVVHIASFGNCGDSSIVRLNVRGKDLDLTERRFNAEADRWPYEDGEFDVVVACEMLEHLAMDPMHVFAEANRVLEPGGRLFVSTPNASSLQNAVKSLAFRAASMAPHYRSPANLSGIYERHNRELTPPALAAMFRCAGFSTERFATVDNYPFSDFGVDHRFVEIMRAMYGDHLRGDTLNFIGVKSGPVVERFPEEEELYIASDRQRSNVDSSASASAGSTG